jgi:hypothetical protein
MPVEETQEEMDMEETQEEMHMEETRAAACRVREEYS